jgi:predicted O-methyltransferase YrrM
MSSGNAALDWIVELSANIPGWRAGDAAKAVAEAAYGLKPDPTIVEVGVFMGRTTFLLAGARRLQGNGRVHCVDPFDCSGDPPSVPHYKALLKTFRGQTLEQVFRQQMKQFKCENTVTIYKGTSRRIAAGWRLPIDLLLLDADHSPEGAREAFESWTPFVKQGGLVVLDNTEERVYEPMHDGNYRMAKERLKAPHFENVYRVTNTTFATVT